MRHRSGDDESAGEALWRFSLALYARPGVAQALIGLQDRAGRDVNLILFALWLGAAQAHRTDRAELAVAVAAIAPLNELVAPLRRLRRRLKSDPDGEVQALRRRVAALELAAERRVQQRLAASLAERRPAASADRLAAATANLALCLDDATDSPEANLLRRAVAALMRRGGA